MAISMESYRLMVLLAFRLSNPGAQLCLCRPFERNKDFPYLLAPQELAGLHRQSFARRRMMWDIADGWVWALVIVGGPLLIGIFMAVFSRRRRLTRNEQKVSDEVAHKNWGKEQIR